MAGRMLVLAVLLASAAVAAGGPAADSRQRTYHLDSAAGDDGADGLTPATAWKTLDRLARLNLQGGDKVLFRRGSVWRGNIRLQSGADGAPVYYGPYGEGPRPLILGSWSRSREEDWERVGGRSDLWSTRRTNAVARLGGDIGMVLFDGEKTGWKKWSREELANEYDFWYDAASDRLCLKLAENPARRHKSVELARRLTVVGIAWVRHAVVESLAIRNAGAFGFGGMGAKDLTIRDCSIAWIGGAHQFTTPAGKPVRYGNAIEFWGSAEDVLVEGCDIRQVYDAAVTPQASGDLKTVFRNVVFRDNLIRDVEYSLEIWHGCPSGRLDNVVFEHNTCIGAGRAWSHAQRPNPNGSHFLSYRNHAAATNVVVRNNVFDDATEQIVRMDNDWRADLTFSRNLVYGTGANTFVHYGFLRDGRPGGKNLLIPSGEAGFSAYREKTGLDADSLYGKPVYRDPANGDWRLAPGTPGSGLATDGGAVGVRKTFGDRRRIASAAREKKAGDARRVAGRLPEEARAQSERAYRTDLVDWACYVDDRRGDDANDGHSPETAWKSVERVNAADLAPGTHVLFRRGGVFRGRLVSASGRPGAPVVYGAYGEGDRPCLQPSVDASEPTLWKEAGPGVWSFDYGFDEDAGNLVFGHGADGCARKRDRAEQLAEDLDFWCDRPSKRVLLKSRENPGRRFPSVEIALRYHAVDAILAHDVVYDGLHLRYSAAHGFGGMSVRRLVVRNCDVSWIGGGILYRDDKGNGVRYGNGIEFWGGAEDVLVESNRVWECWDAGLTHQASDADVLQRNVVWRGNEVWNCEYSYEYWQQGDRARTEGVRFEGNECRDAGNGWGHSQRWNPNAAHLMFYDTTAATKDFQVVSNRFVRSRDCGMRLFNDWRKDLTMRDNVWDVPDRPVCRYHGRPRTGLDFRYPDRLDRTHVDSQAEIESQGTGACVIGAGRYDELKALLLGR